MEVREESEWLQKGLLHIPVIDDHTRSVEQLAFNFVVRNDKLALFLRLSTGSLPWRFRHGIGNEAFLWNRVHPMNQ
jgi:hypothetical protein